MSIYVQEPEEPVKACILWMHGLGADASDMMGLVQQLSIKGLGLRHVFLNAPTRPVPINRVMLMPAWYDILGTELTDREDKQGIEASEQFIRQVIEIQIKEGLSWDQIFLAGFSQGGAMALYTALHLPHRLAGVIALSAYLPRAAHAQGHLDKKTPIFMGAGQFDPLVLPKWSQQCKDWLLAQGYGSIDYHQYPMEHSICFEEIKDISLWLSKQVRGVMQ